MLPQPRPAPPRDEHSLRPPLEPGLEWADLSQTEIQARAPCRARVPAHAATAAQPPRAAEGASRLLTQQREGPPG